MLQHCLQCHSIIGSLAISEGLGHISFQPIKQSVASFADIKQSESRKQNLANIDMQICSADQSKRWMWTTELLCRIILAVTITRLN